MIGHLATTWLIPVAIGVITFAAGAALASGGKRLRASVRRTRTIEPGVWVIEAPGPYQYPGEEHMARVAEAQAAEGASRP